MDDLDSCLDELDSCLGTPLQQEPPLASEKDVSDDSEPEQSEGEMEEVTDAFGPVVYWDSKVKPYKFPASALRGGQRADAAGSAVVPVSLEVLRIKSVGTLLGWLQKESQRCGIDFRTPMFERWILGARHCQWDREEATSARLRRLLPNSDPILPSAPLVEEGILLGKGKGEKFV